MYKRNYSQDDLLKLINERQNKALYINKALDNDIHINMTLESNSPLKEKEKYFRNYQAVKNILDSKTERKNNNFNYINKRYYYNNENQNNADINNNVNYSLNLNKPFHRERKHFPLINNSGNFFLNKNYNLISNTDKLIIRNNQNNYMEKFNNQSRNRNNEYNEDKHKFYGLLNDKNSINKNIRRNNSMIGIQNNLPKIIEKNHRINSEINKNYEEINEYNYPKKYISNQQRFADDEYKYLINKSMKGDISLKCKYPPIYSYNNKMDYRKNFNNY
jgi:hypothetical protein